MNLTGFCQFRCKCGSSRLRRSARRDWKESLLGRLLLPWRCEVCDTRSFKLIWVGPRFKRHTPFRARALDVMATAYDRGTGPSDLK
jgi:hypothetical protein